MTFRDLKLACLRKFRHTSAIPIMSEEELDRQFNDFLEQNDTAPQRAAILDFIFHGIETAKPSDGYKLLVLLAKEGFIDAIITTNLDELLELAQQELKLNVFQIYAPGIASPCVIDNKVYIPPRPLYIKIHGDIRSRTITHLTRREIESKEYPRPFSMLLHQIFTTYKLVFVGYSGNDGIFARQVSAHAKYLTQPVYWCNLTPIASEAPLAKALSNIDIRFVKATFEEVFTEGSVACLSTASLLDSVQFVAPLLREKYRQLNDQFLDGLPLSSREERLKLLVPRRLTAEKIAVFRANSDKPLAVLTGLSGTGKSIVLAQLCDAQSDNDLSQLIIVRARSMSSSDFAKEVSLSLGYSSENPLALLYHFSSWLLRRGESLTIAVDGLNEFGPSTAECLTIFREIVRTALWLQKHGTIKVIVTIRSESWNEIYSFLDVPDLTKVLWVETDYKDKISAIHLSRFDPNELESAYSALARHYIVSTPLRQIDEDSRNLLADPYLLSLVLQNREVITPDTLDYDIYRKAHQEKLKASLGYRGSQSAELGLARLTLLCLEKRSANFSIDDILRVNISKEQIPTLLETSILSQVGRDLFCFSHDRVHESYLVMAINDLAAVDTSTLESLLRSLEIAADYPRLRSALRQCFAHPPLYRSEHYTELMFAALVNALSAESIYSEKRRRLLVEFAKSVLIEIASNSPTRFCELAHNILANKDEKLLQTARVVLHACCVLKSDRAIPLMLTAAQSRDIVLGNEAIILLYDRIKDVLLSDFRRAKQILCSEPLSRFFLGEDVGPGRQIIRCLGIVSQIGWDNTHPSEWTGIFSAVRMLLEVVSSKASTSDDVLADIPDLVVLNAHRFLFNAGEDLMASYFMSSARQHLFSIYEIVHRGNPLTIGQVQALHPYINKLGQTFEFIICNMLFVLSMRNEPKVTLKLFEEYFGTFSRDTQPEEVDFFLSALCFSHLSLGYNLQEIVSTYTEKILQLFPEIVLLNPGAVRGQRRFSDPFDQQFEDGFNPLAFYFYNAPAKHRRDLLYIDYVREQVWDSNHLSLYWQSLEEFESRGHLGGAIRIVHALGQMISLWPIEGLGSLQKLLGRTDPLIRRAIVRVLAEAYARFPGETALLMAQSGTAFTEEEKFAIKCGTDPRLLERSFEQLQWARILYFLDQSDRTGEFLGSLTGILVQSVSLPEALDAILRLVIRMFSR